MPNADGGASGAGAGAVSSHMTEGGSGSRAVEANATAVRALSNLWRDTSPALRDRVAACARDDAGALADVFYDTLLNDPKAATYLSHDLVRTRLRASMARWIAEVFSVRDEDDMRTLVERNFHVGAVHARVDIPLTLITLGMRVIKRDMARRLMRNETTLPPEQTGDAILFLGDVLDTLADNMHEAYLSDMVGNVRQRQSLKMHMSGESLALEGERLKASLFDWLRSVMVALYDDEVQAAVLPPLETSDFGLWLNHKADLAFGGMRELDVLREMVAAITRRIAEARAGNHPTIDLIRQLDRDVTEVAFLLSSVTTHAVELETGRDSLTRLLTRRFLPSILQREVAMSMRHGRPFAVMLVDGDHFKAINDTYGHDGGDRVLVSLAETLSGCVRAGDFAFRYGGEEFLLVLAEMNASTLAAKAEAIRREVEARPIDVGDGVKIRVTISVGAALHDGHPDYQRVIKAADDALYAAKDGGRNAVRVAPPPT
ncbi:Putative Heme-regulated two-component response regulator [Caenispirillum salinarum AK4]|uniref:Diguanylate cyclase DosC n=1 Tax=Caenispirillum salinarum AK4 TaxID=1238182 RepID=K9H2Z3_9PROT|nr:diguanylate cyclase [Caenispirillum salinarum]EKV31952.1 Putative Heme-regulated two-component response regulator [Caenispirillum salinarum AK4]